MYYILFVYRFILFTDHRLLCTAGANAVVQCMVGTVIFLRLIRRISYPSFVQSAPCRTTCIPNWNTTTETKTIVVDERRRRKFDRD